MIVDTPRLPKASSGPWLLVLWVTECFEHVHIKGVQIFWMHMASFLHPVAVVRAVPLLSASKEGGTMKNPEKICDDHD
jgi:hypothetical protein